MFGVPHIKTKRRDRLCELCIEQRDRKYLSSLAIYFSLRCSRKCKKIKRILLLSDAQANVQFLTFALE